MDATSTIRPLSVRVEQAAQITGLSKDYVYELVAKGRIPSFKVGRARLILYSDLEAFLDQARAAA